MLKTYDDIVMRYPDLAAMDGYDQKKHEKLIMVAYLAGRVDRLDEEIERDQKKMAEKKLEEKGGE